MAHENDNLILPQGRMDKILIVDTIKLLSIFAMFPVNLKKYIFE